MAPRAWPHLLLYRHVGWCPAIHFQVTHSSLNSLQNTLLKPYPSTVCATASRTIRVCSRDASCDAQSVVAALCCSCCAPDSASARCCTAPYCLPWSHGAPRRGRLTVLMASITAASIHTSGATATAATIPLALDPVVAASIRCGWKTCCHQRSIDAKNEWSSKGFGALSRAPRRFRGSEPICCTLPGLERAAIRSESVPQAACARKSAKTFNSVGGQTKNFTP